MILNELEAADLRRKFPHEPIVLTGGTFDILHTAHLDFLDTCRTYGDILVVAIANDTEVRSRKGVGRPVTPAEDRARIIDSLKATDYTTVRTDNSLGTSMARIIQIVRPDIVVVAADMSKENPEHFNKMKQALGDADLLVVELSRDGKSTSAILRTLQKGSAR